MTLLDLIPSMSREKSLHIQKQSLPVHMQGVPGRIDQIVDVANRHDLQFLRIVVNALVDAIEDALSEQLVMRELGVSISSK